jgi:hypothetical protein
LTQRAAPFVAALRAGGIDPDAAVEAAGRSGPGSVTSTHPLLRVAVWRTLRRPNARSAHACPSRNRNPQPPPSGTVVPVPLDDLPDWLPAWCVDHLGDEPAGVLFGLQQVSMVFGLRLADGTEAVVKARADDGRAVSCVAAQ